MAFSPDIFNASILVVDDRENNVELIRSMLRAAGYASVSSTVNPLEVCNLHRRNRYDLILLDLMMPRLNGYEFIDRVQSDLGDGRPHIIVFTAAGKRGVDKIPADAVCNSILKPFDLEKFIEMIGECLEGDHRKSVTPTSPDGPSPAES